MLPCRCTRKYDGIDCDGAGAVQTTYEYGAFGKTVVNGTSTNPFQYTGRENDGAGLYYYRARFYSTKMDRFLSEDPIIRVRCLQQTFPNLSDTFSSRPQNSAPLNAYAYVNGNPIRFADPSGLDKDPRCVNRCVSQCGRVGVICGYSIVYVPACAIGCVLVNLGSPLSLSCGWICAFVTVYSVSDCANEVRKCGINCTKKC
ncbi:RHS repeat-associated core domain-containing protein [Nitrospira defluvii]|nr:RHS repeat-associated core domain-containing protein [Nitrospira defluvii]